MPFRVSFFWSQKADLNSGWSENFWNGATDLANVTAPAESLRLALRQVHGAQTGCEYIRISDVTNFRQVTILKFPPTILPAPGGIQDSDFPNVGGLLRLTANPKYSVTQFLRSTDDADINNGGVWNPRPATITRLNALYAQLTSASNGWCVRVQDVATPKQVVAAITNNGVVTVIGHGYATNDRIRISRAKGTLPVNKIWQIVKIDNDSFSLIGWVAPNPAGVYLGNGKAIKQTPVFIAISTAKVIRAVARKTGRPFALSSGKNKKKKLTSA